MVHKQASQSRAGISGYVAPARNLGRKEPKLLMQERLSLSE